MKSNQIFVVFMDVEIYIYVEDFSNIIIILFKEA